MRFICFKLALLLIPVKENMKSNVFSLDWVMPFENIAKIFIADKEKIQMVGGFTSAHNLHKCFKIPNAKSCTCSIATDLKFKPYISSSLIQELSKNSLKRVATDSYFNDILGINKKEGTEKEKKRESCSVLRTYR